MQNRLYTVIDKSLFHDPDNILLGVFEFCELAGEDGRKVLDKIKGFFPYAHTENGYSDGTGIKSTSVYRRDGRRDKDTEDIKSVISMLGIKSDVQVKGGREFYFCDGAGQNQIDSFLKGNVNVYVYICDVAGKPKEALLASENPIISEFCQASYTELVRMRKRFDLKMAIDDLMCVQNYFISESREPSLVEIKIIDNFFSENFRHTTFETILDSIETDDEAVAQAWEHYRELRGNATPSLSDITKAAKLCLAKENVVSATGKLSGIRIETADADDELLLVVKNESHNRSTTAVPYDGAAGCIGGAVKDLLCALAYPYDSVRVVGQGADGIGRKNAAISTAGYAETASSIGVPCSKCSETVSHNYDDKQREVCSVLAVANRNNAEKVLKKSTQCGDKIYVVGGKTGADGANCLYTNLKNENSVGEYIPITHSGELSALKRLFVSQELADIAVAINDISSGGIVCALGEITEGADIDVGAVASRYSLTISEAILSESNERMVVCVRAESGSRLEALCKTEGIECSCIGEVNSDKRFVIYDAEKNRVASLTRAFLLSGGAEKHLSATIGAEEELGISEALVAAKAPLGTVNPIKKLFGRGVKYDYEKAFVISAGDVEATSSELASAYNIAAGGDMSELDRSTMASAVSHRRLSYNGSEVIGKNGKAVYSAIACGAASELCERAPFKSAYLSIVEAVLKLVCAGYGENDIHLSLHEYFPEHKNNSARLGTSVASMLGCFEAQMQLGIPSIGGRISIGGGESDKEKISIVSAFAFCLCENGGGVGKALVREGSRIVLLSPEMNENGLPDGNAIFELIKTVNSLKNSGALISASVVNVKNPATVLMEMCKAGNKGVSLSPDCDIEAVFGNAYASVICELKADAEPPKEGVLLGYTCKEYQIVHGEYVFKLKDVIGDAVTKPSKEFFKQYLYLKKPSDSYGSVKPVNKERVSVLIPLVNQSAVADDIVAAFRAKGASVRCYPLSEHNVGDFAKQLKKTDVLWLCDTVGGNAVINAALSDKRVKAELDALRERQGLIFGQGSSFESLLMSGLIELDTEKVKLSNTAFINKTVRLRATSLVSPFTRLANVGEEYISFVSGRRTKLSICSEYADELARAGRIIAQYTHSSNVTGSELGVDAVCSADGRVLGQISRAFGDGKALPTVQSVMSYFSNYN